MSNDTYELFYLVRQWGREKGITGEGGFGTPSAQFQKFLEEAGELGRALMEENGYETVDALGDCTVVLILLADLMGLKLEHCLDSAYEVIRRRNGKIVNGVFVKEEGTE